MTTTQHDFRVGDILTHSWGYDQTNIDFYAVIRTTAKKVEIAPIGSEVVDTHRTSLQVTADPTVWRDFDVIIQTGRCSPEGKPRRETKLCATRCTSYRGVTEWLVVLSDRYTARRYDGVRSETAPGFGH